MNIQRIAAFSDENNGGNPAGIVLSDTAIDELEMRRIATEIGYSETAFAVPLDATMKNWRVRYFSPESEVPFCGHATIALGAALTEKHGPQNYALTLNAALITVEGTRTENGVIATLSSPPTHSQPISKNELDDVLTLFGLAETDLDTRLPPARIHGGADHLMLALKDRTQLSAMAYDLDKGRQLMLKHRLITVMLVTIKDNTNFEVRNAFASGGVLEDPATGAAAAAFAGYLRDQSWPHGGAFQIVQGEDMGARSVINVRLTDEKGAPVQVSGTARDLEQELRSKPDECRN